MQHKRALLTWLAIYPLITLLSWLFGDYLMQIALPVRTLILTLILVPLLAYAVLPFLNKVFAKWLSSGK